MVVLQKVSYFKIIKDLLFLFKVIKLLIISYLKKLFLNCGYSSNAVMEMH